MNVVVTEEFHGIAADFVADEYTRRMRDMGWAMSRTASGKLGVTVTMVKECEVPKPPRVHGPEMPPTERWLVEQVMILNAERIRNREQATSKEAARAAADAVLSQAVMRGKRTLAGLAMADMDLGPALGYWTMDDNDALLEERRRRIQQAEGGPRIVAKPVHLTDDQWAERPTTPGEHAAFQREPIPSLREVNDMLRRELGEPRTPSDVPASDRPEPIR